MRPYPPVIRRNVLDALKVIGRIQPIARAYRIHNTTIARWAKEAGLNLDPAALRIKQGNRAAIEKRWGNVAARRAAARELRRQGLTLDQIRAQLGYRSIAAIHYALRH